MSRCGICNTSAIGKKSPSIPCSGPCNKLYHLSCIGASTDIVQHMAELPGLKWRCDTCIQLHEPFVDKDKLQAVFQEKVDSFLEEGFNSMLDGLKTQFMDIAKNKLSEIIQSNLNELIASKIDELKPKIDQMSINVKGSKASYSSVAKKQPSFVIKPKNKQDVTTTKSDMIRNINPVESNLNITKIKGVRDGGLVVSCENSDECLKFKQLVNDKLNDNYTVKEVPALNPRFKIVGISENLNDETLVTYIKNQNKTMIFENSVINVISRVPLKKNEKVYQAVIQTDIATYHRVIGCGKMFIGYDYCSVFDAIDLRRCYKCCGYRHISKQCSSNIHICPLCAQNHRLDECPKTGILNCINCHNYNKSNKDPVNVNHAAWDKNCHVYNLTLNKFKDSIISPQ